MRLLATTIAAATLAFGLARGATEARPAGAVHAMPSTWYKCPTGATLEVLGNDSRCHYAPSVTVYPLAGCPYGTTPTVDGIPTNVDSCNSGKTPSPRTCSDTRYQKVVVAGADRCEYVTVRPSQAPNIAATI